MDEDPRAGHGQKESTPETAAGAPVGSGLPDAAGGPLAPAGPRTYALGRINVIVLGSARETLEAGLLSTEFSFPQCSVGSVVIHTCLSGNDRQSAHGWLFQSAEPDLFRERPIAELAINSMGDAAVSPGCPPDYDALAVRVFPPAVQVPAAPPVRSRKVVLMVALAAALVVPWAALIVLADRVPAARHTGEHSLAVTPWITRSTVEPLPIVLPTSPAPEAAVDEIAPVRRASAARAPPAGQRKTVKKTKPAAPAAPIARAAEVAGAGAGASTAQAAVSENPRVLVAEGPRVIESGAGRLAREQAACANGGVRGAFCREAARWTHCHPDKWDAAPECMVQKAGLAQ